jgi:hypothetical protein
MTGTRTPESEVAEVELPGGARGHRPDDEHEEAEAAAPLDDPPLGVVQLVHVVLVIREVSVRVRIHHGDVAGRLPVVVLGRPQTDVRQSVCFVQKRPAIDGSTCHNCRRSVQTKQPRSCKSDEQSSTNP